MESADQSVGGLPLENAMSSLSAIKLNTIWFIFVVVMVAVSGVVSRVPPSPEVVASTKGVPVVTVPRIAYTIP